MGLDGEAQKEKGGTTMKTHVERLPEYYPIRDEYLSFVSWLTGISPVNRLPEQDNREGTKETAAKRVLVIDDEEKIRETYGRILLSMGLDVATVPNAVEAQKILVRNHFDMVLLDINMAEVDGSILFEVMKTFHKHIKVVVSSVYSIDEQKERIKDADGYFDKSEGKDVLVSLVSALT